MNIIQSYAQGARHIANSLPCEDRTFGKIQNGACVIALADGAGSSKYTHSAQGAECITETICNFFCNNFDKFYDIEAEKEQQQVITAICRHALKQKAEKIGLDSITKMSSTMLCVAVKDGKAVVCHIGDGVIGALTDDGVKIVSKPDNGEFASTTYFIASSAASEHLRIQKFPLNGEHAFFMMSDGVSEYVYNENSGEFNNGALKMSLMAFEKSGNESLAKTIDEFMIKKDSASDDCSFICVSLTDTVPPAFVAQEEKADTPEADSSISTENDSNSQYDSAHLNSSEKRMAEVNSAVENFNQAPPQHANDNTNNKSNKKKIIVVTTAVIVLVCAIVITAVGLSSKSKHDTKLAKNSTTASQKASEKQSTNVTIETQTVTDAPTAAPSTQKADTTSSRSYNRTSSTRRYSQTTQRRSYISKRQAPITKKVTASTAKVTGKRTQTTQKATTKKQTTQKQTAASESNTSAKAE